MKKMMYPLLGAALIFGAPVEGAEKIALSICNFRPLAAELNKYLTPIQRQAIEADPLPISAEERAILDSKTLTVLKTEEFFAKLQARKEKLRQREEAYKKQEEQIEKLRDSIYKDPENRPLLNGAKKLIARLSQYDVFKILERNDMAELLNEASGESGDKSADLFSLARMASAYNVIVDVGDMHHQVHSGSVGGVNFEDTTYSREFILKVQNMLDGSVALSMTTNVKKKVTKTDVGGTSDDGQKYEDILNEAIDGIAQAIYKKFVASYTFEFKPVGKIDGFEPSAISLSILDKNGELITTATNGEKVDLVKGNYDIAVDGDEYLFVGSRAKKAIAVKESKKQVESFEKATQEVEFTFKASEEVFPSVTLTPKGWDGEPIEISDRGPIEIRKGAYELTATCEGYKDMKKNVTIGSTMKKYDVSMTELPQPKKDAGSQDGENPEAK